MLNTFEKTCWRGVAIMESRNTDTPEIPSTWRFYWTTVHDGGNKVTTPSKSHALGVERTLITRGHTYENQLLPFYHLMNVEN